MIEGEPATVSSWQQRRQRFDDDWRFFKGDPAGAEAAHCDDSGWRRLALPHDWAIEGPFDPQYNPHAGGLSSGGTAWYRKRFRLDPARAAFHHAIELDGAMANARVFLNGRQLGERPYGYSGFAFDLDELRFGAAENVLAVRLAPEEDASRWYPGAGIYRHVWWLQTADVHVARFGTYVTTPRVDRERALVRIETELRNRRHEAAQITLVTSILDANERVIVNNEQPCRVPADGCEPFAAELELERPHLWEVDAPALYRIESLVCEGGRVSDRHLTPFGVRTIEFDQRLGMLFNGRQLKLRGVCLHHDLGCLGAAVNRRAIERQLTLMKKMGANALRTSHNPPAPELLDCADELGLLVIDEAFDMWRTPKSPNDYSQHFEAWGEVDLRDMIRRDRNHPSVILWSIGNEIPEQNAVDGGKLARRLTEVCHQHDPSRKVTAGFNLPDAALRNGLVDAVDIPGFNYQAQAYERLLAERPRAIIVGSETCSTVSSRGVYHLPLEKYDKHPSLQLTSYDIIGPAWANPPDVEFDAQERLPQVLGEFVWTGFDYLGEPTPYFWARFGQQRDEPDWPARSSYFGIVDLAGFPKDRYFLYQSVWTQEPMVHLLPHWNWAGREGQAIPVFVYSNADEVELRINGRSLGRQRRGAQSVEIPIGESISSERRFMSKYRLLWQVPYEAGTLEAIAFRGGQLVARKQVRTAGVAARLRAQADRDSLLADGEDLAFISVRVEDADGTLCPLADAPVAFDIQGPGALAGTDNGNPATLESFRANPRRAFNGLCLLVLRPTRAEPGTVRVVASSPGLDSSELAIVTRAIQQL